MSKSSGFGAVFTCAFILASPLTAQAERVKDIPATSSANDLRPQLAQAPKQVTQEEAEEPTDLEEVTVTGGRSKKRSETTSPIYVIDKLEIEQKGARTVADAVRNVPGVTTNIFGAGADVHNGFFIRGVPTTSTAILIDGRAITNLNQEHYDPSEIPINNVERIEVMPSGGTTLYGSTALGGVINVITRKPTKPLEGQISVEFGSYGYSKYGAYYQGKSGPISYNLNIQNFNTLNNFYYQVQRPVGTLSGIRPNGDNNLRSYNFDLGYEIDSRNTLTLNTYLRNSAKGVSPFSITDTRPNVSGNLSAEQLGLNDDHKSRLSTDTYGLALTWDSKLGQGTIQICHFGFLLDRALNQETANDGEGFTTEINLLAMRGVHNWQINPIWNITYGFDYLKEIGKSEAFNSRGGPEFDTSSDRPALFVINDIKLASNLIFQAGARYSLTDQFGNSFDPNVGLRWQIAPNFALRTNFNQGFKVPNFNDLYGKTVHKGNPNLRPERGSFFDIGFDWQPTPTTDFRFTAFASAITNLLTLNLVDPRLPDYRPLLDLGYETGDRVRVNYPSLYSTGFEFSFNWKMAPNWEFFLTETYTDARVIDGLRQEVNQTQYALVPFHMGRIGFGYQDPNGFRSAIFANFVGGRSVDTYHVGPGDVFETDGNGNPVVFSHIGKLNTGDLLPGYTTIDLSLRFPVTPGLILNAYIDNLLGTYYEKSYGGPGPGTNFRIGLASNF